MFSKTAFAVITAIVLAASYASAQAKTNPRSCVSSSLEEGALSAFPAWSVCKP